MISELSYKKDSMNPFYKILPSLRQMILHVGPWWLALQRKLRYSESFLENPVGLAGGLAVFWNDQVSLKVAQHSSAFLDFICTDLEFGLAMHLALAVRR